MKFALSAEQRQFGSSVHDLLARADVPAAARDWAIGDHAAGLVIWRSLGKAGVTALAIPEQHGGLGAHPVDLVVACEELGHHPLPGPVAESLGAVPPLLAALAGLRPGGPPDSNGCPVDTRPDDAAPGSTAPGSPRPGSTEPGSSGSASAGLPADWLTALACGELVATFARPPQLPYALDADAAGLVLLADVSTVWLAVPRARLESADQARRLFEVCPTQALASGPEAAAAVTRAISYGTLASAAQLLGAGRALLEATTNYARQREQFGRPIGAFQAIKHALADVLIALEFARPLLYAAAIALGSDAPTTARDISAARVACADAAQRAARTALQVHGAIGYTAECDISMWLAKVRALGSTWGSQAEHRAAVLAALTGDRAGRWS